MLNSNNLRAGQSNLWKFDAPDVSEIGNIMPLVTLADVLQPALKHGHAVAGLVTFCLLYTSDAADDLLCVDLGGRRIIKKKK